MCIMMTKLLDMKLSKLVLFLAFCVFCGVAISQDPTSVLTSYRQKYPGQHTVILKDNHTVKIDLVKGVPELIHCFELEYIILDKNGLVALNEEYISFSVFEEIQNINAYSLVPNKSGYKKIMADNFRTRDAEADQGSFYDGNRETVFRFPGLVIGAKRYLYYESTMSHPEFPFGHTFYGSITKEQSSFSVVADSAFHFLVKQFNGEIANLKVTETVEKGKRIIQCTTDSILAPKNDIASASYRYFAPHVLVQMTHYNYKGKRTDVGGTLTALHNDYRTNISEVVNEEPNESIRKIADSLTSNIDNEFEKVKAIYYWIQDNIKYVAFEKGIGGYVPRQPNAVIQKRFGDCKDMASLIYSMLKAVKIESYLTWVGSRSLPYKYSEFPTSFCDNHMITVYKYQGKNYFLDATNSYQNIDEPTSFIQGKEAFISINPEKYEVATIPVIPAAQNIMLDTTLLTIENRSIKGKTKTILNGYTRNDLTSYYLSGHGKTDAEFISRFLEKGNNSFRVIEGKIQLEKERTTDFVMDYTWEATNYVTTLQEEMFINLHIEEIGITSEMKKDRIAPLEMEYKTKDNYVVILEIPEGYHAEKLPLNTNYETDELKFSNEYSIIGNQIIMTVELTIDFILLEKDKFSIWNEYNSLRKKAFSESIVLKKI